MARQARTILEGVTYHCYSLCHDTQNLLQSNLAKKFFIDAVQKCQEKYTFELSSVEVVSNHFHMSITTLEGEESISRIMQYIKARTAEKYNRAMNRRGAFWIGRFKCTIIEESDDPVEYSFRLFWYIAFNPVRKGLSSDPRNNYIGFINCYLVENYELSVPIKITPHPYFNLLGDTFSERVERFLLYEEAYRKRIGLYF
jgi:putative transposase